MTLAKIATGQGHYTLEALLSKGTASKVYSGTDESGARVAVKIATAASDNRLLRNEHYILSRLKSVLLLRVIDTFETEDGRVGTIFPLLDGMDLTHFRSRKPHRDGINDHFHLGWIIERLLAAAGELHKAMTIHGNIQPQHIFLNAPQHHVYIIDFCFAHSWPTERAKIGMWTDDFSAPEVRSGAPPLPGMDIYSIGKCAVYIAGGDPATGEIPRSIHLDKRAKLFIGKLIEPNYLKRPRDAWELAREWLSLRRAVWGPPQWRELEL